jgi:prepilin-type N-terminal cleavage/methylation domain-containing protein
MNVQIFSLKKNISFTDSGFTIIEVLMAMTIFVIGFLAVASMQIAAVNGNTSARMRTSASILAADIVEQLMRCPYESSTCTLVRTHQINDIDVVQYTTDDPLAMGAHGPFDDDPDGDGPDRSYEVRWVVGNGPEVNSKEIDVTVTWQKLGQNQTVQYNFLAGDANI